MADISYDENGLAYEFYGPSATLENGGRGRRRSDLDISKPKPPPLPPDLSDELVQRARTAMVRRQLMGQGLASTFLTGPIGLTSPAPTQSPGLFGS